MKRLERYKPEMTEDIVHSWAVGAQVKIDKMAATLKILMLTLGPSYERRFLEEMMVTLDLQPLITES